MHPEIRAKTPGKCTKCGMDLTKYDNTDKVKKEVYFTCTNDSEIHQDKKGFCPKCKHKLKKIKNFIY
jgi:transcription initiation factor IIE alpha subunit